MNILQFQQYINLIKKNLNLKFRGNGNLYVLIILGTAMAGAFALTGGFSPQLNQTPSAADTVLIDENSANRSAEKNLQLVDIKIKPSPIPTRVPTATQIPTLTVTTTPTACLNKTAILVLADLSASMQFDNKTAELRNALRILRDKLQPETGIGLYAFGSYSDPNFVYAGTRGVREIVAMNKYRDNKDRFDPAVNSLVEGGLGGTYMRPGFQVAIDRLNRAQERTTYFNNYQYVTIVFSDGVPERMGGDIYPDKTLGECTPERPVNTPPYTYQKCFAQELDPRPDLVAELKRESKVYSVVVYDTRNGEDDSYFVSPVDRNDRLRTLMKDVATSPTSTYYDVEVRGVNRLANIFQGIVEGICR